MPVTPVEEARKLILEHDWFYEYANGDTWRRGSAERHNLIEKLRKIPGTELAELFKLVPAELKDQFFLDLQRPRK